MIDRIGELLLAAHEPRRPAATAAARFAPRSLIEQSAVPISLGKAEFKARPDSSCSRESSDAPARARSAPVEFIAACSCQLASAAQSSSRPDASHAAPMMSALIAGVAAPFARRAPAAPAEPRAPRAPSRAPPSTTRPTGERPAPSGARSSRRSFFSAAFAATLSGASDPALGRRDPARASTSLRAASPSSSPGALPASPRARVVPARSAETDVMVSPLARLPPSCAGAFLVESSSAAPALLADSDARPRPRPVGATSASAAFELAEAAPGAEIYRQRVLLGPGSTSLWRRSARRSAGAPTRSPPSSGTRADSLHEGPRREGVLLLRQRIRCTSASATARSCARR